MRLMITEILFECQFDQMTARGCLSGGKHDGNLGEYASIASGRPLQHRDLPGVVQVVLNETVYQDVSRITPLSARDVVIDAVLGEAGDGLRQLQMPCPQE